MISPELDVFLKAAWKNAVSEWSTEVHRRPSLFQRQCEECLITLTVAFRQNQLVTSPVGNRGFCPECKEVTTFIYNLTENY